jgi:hypothetical protein
MPAIGAALCEKAGTSWTPECDSRAEDSRGGSTVTAVRLQAMISAVDALIGSERDRPTPADIERPVQQ